MIGLNLYFDKVENGEKSFPDFGDGCLTSYDKSVDLYRLHIRDAYLPSLNFYLDECEATGFTISAYHFAVDPQELLNFDSPAYVVSPQHAAFFENSLVVDWCEDEKRKLIIPNKAEMVDAGHRLVFSGDLADYFLTLRNDLNLKPVATVDRLNRQFYRFLEHPEYSFLSPATVFKDRWTLLWVAQMAEPPDDLFFDSVGPVGGMYQMVVSRNAGMELQRRLDGVPMTPIFAAQSDLGKATVLVGEMLKERIYAADLNRKRSTIKKDE